MSVCHSSKLVLAWNSLMEFLNVTRFLSDLVARFRWLMHWIQVLHTDIVSSHLQILLSPIESFKVIEWLEQWVFHFLRRIKIILCRWLFKSLLKWSLGCLMCCKLICRRLSTFRYLLQMALKCRVSTAIQTIRTQTPIWKPIWIVYRAFLLPITQTPNGRFLHVC